MRASALYSLITKMGITIHYTFMVRNKDAVCRILKEIKETALKVGIKILYDRETCLGIHPHPGCESMNLDFSQWKEVKQAKEWSYCKEVMLDFEKVLHDDDYVCASFTKTQYAGYKVHVIVAEMLRKIAARCTLAHVSDEADYYETRSTDSAVKNFDESSKMISNIAGMLKETFGKDNVYCSIDNIENEP